MFYPPRCAHIILIQKTVTHLVVDNKNLKIKRYSEHNLGDTHKYVWLASPDQPNFCSKVRVGWLASMKTKKKLKSSFISISHLLVIEVGIVLT